MWDGRDGGSEEIWGVKEIQTAGGNSPETDCFQLMGLG